MARGDVPHGGGGEWCVVARLNFTFSLPCPPLSRFMGLGYIWYFFAIFEGWGVIVVFLPARRLFGCLPVALGFAWFFCLRGAFLSVCLRRWPFLDLILVY